MVTLLRQVSTSRLLIEIVNSRVFKLVLQKEIKKKKNSFFTEIIFNGLIELFALLEWLFSGVHRREQDKFCPHFHVKIAGGIMA